MKEQRIQFLRYAWVYTRKRNKYLLQVRQLCSTFWILASYIDWSSNVIASSYSGAFGTPCTGITCSASNRAMVMAFWSDAGKTNGHLVRKSQNTTTCLFSASVKGSVWSLISDVGGNTGLFLGLTLLSGVELLMLVVELIQDCCFKSKGTSNFGTDIKTT